MKKALLLFIGLFLVSGCGSYYGVIKETQAGDDLKKYKAISVSWLDLGPERWKSYDFESQAKWAESIDHANKVALPDFFKKAMPNKTMSFVTSPKEAPRRDGLVVKFTEAQYMQRTSTAAKVMFGSFAGSDTLDLTIHFIDGKSGKELQQIQVSVYSKSAWDYSGWGFEGRLNNCIYNLGHFIAERVQ